MTDSYHDLEKKIKKLMSTALQAGTATVEDITFLAYILSKTTEAIELNFLAQHLAEKYPFLSELALEEKQEKSVAKDAKVQEFISHLVQTDPAKAAEIGMKASRPDADLDLLRIEYPELDSYLNN